MISRRHAGLAVAIAAAMVGPAAADDFETSVVIKDHVFTPMEIKVPAGVRVILTVDNQDPTPEEFESPELKVEKVIPGGSKGKVQFGPLEAGTYLFIGEFNQKTARGVVTAD
jgi:plastocyanin domain-containing protein